MTIPDSCESLLEAMVAIPSVNPRFGGSPDGQAKLAEYLESVARAWGLHTERLAVRGSDFNLLVSHRDADIDAPWLLGESHLDTVSDTGMNVPPFQLSRTDERLYGRGACDTKGSGAAMLWALRNFASNPSTGRNVGVVFTIDEEAGMAGAASFAVGWLSKTRSRVVGVLVGEPTSLRPVIVHNGLARWTMTTDGVAAHSSDPRRGRSAITAMARLVLNLEENYMPRVASRTHPLTGAAACSINVIRGGVQVNVIPDRCEVEVDRRLIPGESFAQALKERDEAIAAAKLDAEVACGPVYAVPALTAELSDGLLQRLGEALRRCGLDATPVGAKYVTNASHYAATGVPAIVFGPGSVEQAHTAAEWISRDELLVASRVYEHMMRGSEERVIL